MAMETKIVKDVAVRKINSPILKDNFAVSRKSFAILKKESNGSVKKKAIKDIIKENARYVTKPVFTKKFNSSFSLRL